MNQAIGHFWFGLTCPASTDILEPDAVSRQFYIRGLANALLHLRTETRARLNGEIEQSTTYIHGTRTRRAAVGADKVAKPAWLHRGCFDYNPH